MELDYYHTHILGKSTDDTTEYIKQQFLNCSGRMLIDLIGALSNELLHTVQEPDLVYINSADLDFPTPMNPLWDVPRETHPDVTDTLLEMFLGLWQYDDFPATRVIDCLYNTIAALLDYPNGTIIGIKLMLTDEIYRRRVVCYVQNPVVRSYWEDEFEALSAKDRQDLIGSTRANIHQVIADPRIRNLFGTPKPKIDFKDIIKKQKTVIVDLSALGKKKARLVGSVLLSMSLSQAGAKKYNVFVIDPGKLSDSVLMDVLDRGQSRRLSLTVSHRYLDQLSDRLKAALFGSVSTQVFFRLSNVDANEIEANWPFSNSRSSLASEIAPRRYRRITPATSDYTMPDDPVLEPVPFEENLALKENTVRLSRRLYGKKRSDVERYIERVIDAGKNDPPQNAGRVPFH